MFKIKIKNGNEFVSLDANAGDNLYQLLAHHEYIHNAPCGGKGTCGKCRVKIIENCPQACDAQKNFLSDKEISDGVRLSCLVEIETDITVEVLSTFHSFGGIVLLDDFCDFDSLSFALDIGTTTLEGVIVDEKTAKPIVKMTKMNPQKKFGADVFTRLNFSLESNDNRNKLKQVVVNDINEMIESMTNMIDSKAENINKIAISANTTMIHMLLGHEVSKLAFAPFVTDFLAPKDMRANDVGIDCSNATLIMSPAASAFVGGDITAGAVSMDIDHDSHTSLFIDLGTNGEMIFSNQGSFVGCSVAAGPAFEGAEIDCGMSALAGAVDDISFDGDISFSTIDDADPIGICGSGLIDTIALLVQMGLIDETGKLATTSDDEKIDARLKQIGDMDSFVIYEDDDKCIYLSQRDVRNFQLAKAAIKTGIAMLMEKEDVDAEKIETVYIAGGFGSHISSENLFKSGIMPFTHENIKIVGNTSLKGSIKTVCDDGFKNRTFDFSEKVDVFLLSEHPNFQMLFVDNMMFE